MSNSRMHGGILRTTDEAPVLTQRHLPGTKYGDDGFINPCWDLDAEEFAALKVSIAKGFSPAFPIIRSAGPAFPGALVDGFHRQLACDETGTAGIYVDLPFKTEAEFRIAQIDANLKRRHLPAVRRAVLIREREEWAEKDEAATRKAQAGHANLASAGHAPAPSAGKVTGTRDSRDALGSKADMSGRTYEKFTYAWDNGDDFIRQEMEAERRGADWGYKAAKEWRTAEAETGERWDTYNAYVAWRTEKDSDLDHQAQWEKEYEELFDHHAGTDPHAPQARAAAHVRQVLTDLDKYWAAHAVIDGDVTDGALHTFRGVLARWSERIADMLALPEEEQR